MVSYQLSPAIDNAALNALFSASWPRYAPRDFQPVLHHNLCHVCAFSGKRLVGFVNLAWDGGFHAFILDTTVHPEFQQRGIGQELVRRAAALARDHNIEWLHVDFEAHFEGFYLSCGFEPTAAGLMRLGKGNG